MIKPILYTMWIIAGSIFVIGVMFFIFLEIIKIDPITITYMDDSQIRMEYRTPTPTRTLIPFPTLIQVGELYNVETGLPLMKKTSPTPTPVLINATDKISGVNYLHVDPYVYPYQVTFSAEIKGCSIAFEDAVSPIKITKQYFDGRKYVLIFERQYDVEKKGKKK